MAQNLKPKLRAPELIQPYGGELVSLLVTDQERKELIEHAGRLPSIQLSHRSLCDLEPPLDPDLTVETINCSPENNARLILEYLFGKGFLKLTTT